MRLGQLSRKINVHSSEIVKFLADEGIHVEDSVNSKIDDQTVNLVFARFAPQLVVKEIREEAEPVDAPVVIEPAAGQIIVESTPEVVAAATEQEPLFQEVSSVAEQIPEVIKAPKAELKGLKIVGKIELPEPRKKEVPPPVQLAENSDAALQPSSPEQQTSTVLRTDKRRPQKQQKERRQDRPRKNPIALQREREEREAEERKREQAKKEKERRTNYYQTRVKPSPPVRAARVVDEPLVDLSQEAPDQPRTLWGKFLKWLTT